MLFTRCELFKQATSQSNVIFSNKGLAVIFC